LVHIRVREIPPLTISGKRQWPLPVYFLRPEVALLRAVAVVVWKLRCKPVASRRHKRREPVFYEMAVVATAVLVQFLRPCVPSRLLLLPITSCFNPQLVVAVAVEIVNCLKWQVTAAIYPCCPRATRIAPPLEPIHLVVDVLRRVVPNPSLLVVLLLPPQLRILRYGPGRLVAVALTSSVAET
jgi:hypothetical protein